MNHRERRARLENRKLPVTAKVVVDRVRRATGGYHSTVRRVRVSDSMKYGSRYVIRGVGIDLENFARALGVLHPYEEMVGHVEDSCPTCRGIPPVVRK